MQNNWLHFIGRGYYTEKTFVQEAIRHLVSRRIQPRMLGGFSWGDRIWLAQGDMKKKLRKKPFGGARVFAYFTLTQVGGLNPQALDGFPGLGELYSNKPVEINRGCGSYTIEAIYLTKESPKALADYLRESAIPTTILLQGPITPLDNWISLPDVGFRLGYQRIPDLNELLMSPRAKGYSISGELTADWGLPDKCPYDTFLETVSRYEVADLYSKPEYTDPDDATSYDL